MVQTKEIMIGNTTYFLKANYKSEDCYVDIETFICVGECYQEKDEIYDPPKKQFPKKGATSSNDTTYNLEDAQRVFSGYIKWDGCSDVDFYPDHRGNEHFCGIKAALALGSLLEASYEFARELMGDKVDDECFYDL